VKYFSCDSKTLRMRATLAALALFFVMTGSAHAQLRELYPDSFRIERPGQLSATLFGGGFISDRYGVTDEGFQLEQSFTQYISPFARATGYQLYLKNNNVSPFNPSSGRHSPRLNFGRFQGGLDFALYPGTDLYVSGGGDAGDAHGGLIEGDFSSWLMPHARHPVNFAFSSIHTFQNSVTSSEIDLELVLLSNEKWMLLGGAGGAIYGGGFIRGSATGQGGPDVGVFYRPWQMGLNLQFGYGSAAHNFGQFNLYKQLTFTE
jgi:hypothetical protein